MKAMNIKKVDFIKGLNVNNYNLVVSHNRLDEVHEVIQLREYISAKDKLNFAKTDGVNGLVVIRKDGSVMVEYLVIESNNKFEIYEMNNETYNNYVNYMRGY